MSRPHRRAPVLHRRLLSVCIASQLCGTLIGPHTALAAYRGRNFSIERPKVGAEASYYFDSEQRTGPFAATQVDNQTLTERIDVETRGWIYHPAMLTYTLRLSPEWRQTQSVPNPGRTSNSDSFLLGYDVNLTVLPYKPYTVNLFARQQSSVLNTSLAPTSQSESSAYGATLNLKYKVLPTTLALTHATLDQTGFYQARENRDDLRLTMRHDERNNTSRFDLTQTSRDRTLLPSGVSHHTENLHWLLTNTYQLRPKNRAYLTSSLNYSQASSGTNEFSSLSLNENLFWRHSKRLNSYYSYQHQRTTSGSLQVRHDTLAAGLAHQLYENLTTTAGLSLSRGSQGDSNYGGNINFNYQRRIPGGAIHANLAQDYRVNHPAPGVVIHVINETLNLPYPGDATLAQQNIVSGSITVTDAGGIPQVAGIDYDLQPIGNSIRIINRKWAPVTFRVSYDYQSPNYDSANRALSYGIGFHLWSAWRFDYRYSHSNQNFLAGIPPEVLAEETRHTIDSELKWRWSTTRFLYENSDSTIGVSLKRWRLEEQAVYRRDARNFYSAAAYFGQTVLKNMATPDKFHGLRADWQHLLTANSRARVEALYNVNDGSVVKTTDKGVAATWEWTAGIWRAEASYRYLDQQDLTMNQTRKRHTLYFIVRRALW